MEKASFSNGDILICIVSKVPPNSFIAVTIDDKLSLPVEFRKSSTLAFTSF